MKFTRTCSVSGRSDAANAYVRAIIVVSPKPLCGEFQRLDDGFNDVLIQPFIPNTKSRSRGLLRLARLGYARPVGGRRRAKYGSGTRGWRRLILVSEAEWVGIVLPRPDLRRDRRHCLGLVEPDEAVVLLG